MQHINRDIDDVFRKAAESYPLKTDNGDWDNVYSRLSGSAKGKTAAFSSKIKRTSFYVAMLLLIFSGLGLYLFNRSDLIHTAKEEISDVEQTAPAKTDKNDLKNTNTKPEVNNASKDKKQLHSTDYFKTEKTRHVTQHYRKGLTISPNESANSSLNNSSRIMADIVKFNNEPVFNNESNTKVLKNESTVKPILSGNNQKYVSSKTPITLKVSCISKLYGGLLVSPDISTIKYQNISKIGIDYGILAGYQMNKHFNIEISVIRNHKHYFSSGKYFNTENLKLRQSTVIEELSGYNRITDVPLSIRYNFLSKKKYSQFFATAGAITSFVHEERYNYSLNQGGNMNEVDRNYKKGSTKVLSNVQLSVGYETPVCTIGNLRIEPYYKLPVRGVGVGEVPLTSFGINTGIVKYLNYKK